MKAAILAENKQPLIIDDINLPSFEDTMNLVKEQQKEEK